VFARFTSTGPYNGNFSPRPSVILFLYDQIFVPQAFSGSAISGVCVPPTSNGGQQRLVGISYGRNLKLTNVGWPPEA
jgi:hypothetical protein